MKRGRPSPPRVTNTEERPGCFDPSGKVARAVPQVASAADQLVRLVWALALDAELVQGQADHAALDMVWIDVDDGQDHVGIVGGALRVREELVVLAGMEPKPTVGLQRGILVPDPVEDR